jgi:hypothetical protein
MDKTALLGLSYLERKRQYIMFSADALHRGEAFRKKCHEAIFGAQANEQFKPDLEVERKIASFDAMLHTINVIIERKDLNELAEFASEFTRNHGGE